MMLSEGDRNFLLEHAAVRRYSAAMFSLIRAVTDPRLGVVRKCARPPTDIELKGFEGTFILWSVK
jgi:hypothetical protein